ncbi:MAG TPA: transcription elongation factor GreA [Hungateiclostridium thermocellum]|jgi:transcription elongation factor GreA|uniref:Transcription elongation factor GreA n=2 Tax=Acetivibrio thermocellus TaxID=1515 RepID=GREA_ACET2|nr:transcription elongation factor GreA [Acetivibrio thermocellus]A3DJG6.1 RecName: Full=Transcription elongation factor GreA; AltName: Full=Transcript cleavage factor GreA [Acetivibrio thermocellus ATCC 27405]CDG37388.1 Transcription elongation factor GreA [Acetivibrio thermocellus BC1]ABN54095.1 GreA/GreB family elongation factor [Acetivibrio thermocellus ATCC 27405]ADU73527.1 transcription elongation factor GreA [Acetivibrio thermocellus DSM 1313]ALX07449.1 transcription elongation factor G
MATNKEVVLTYEGLQKLEQELENLKTVKRREVAERIKQALSFGDISENSEYDEAKNEQAYIEGRIFQLENMLKNAKVIDEEDIQTDVVSIGSKVKVLDMEFDEEVEYYIVGSTEADPSQYKISNESPVGKALIGGKIGDIVEVTVPDGVIKFKILEIRK